jgi:hypothetical protein
MSAPASTLGEPTIYRTAYAFEQLGDWKRCDRGELALRTTAGGPPPAALPIFPAGDAAWKAR